MAIRARTVWGQSLICRLCIGVMMAQPLQAFADDKNGNETLEFFNSEASSILLATKTKMSVEKAPSIVSVVTREDIEAYGARDLADILRLVPGFEFGWDVDGIVGLNFRGIWVHEGKALLMINGQVINEFGYGNYNSIGSLPAAMIQKVEIIRGPGSALYGQFAEVAVINVLTAKGTDLQGLRLHTGAGTLGNGQNSYNADATYGFASENKDIAIDWGHNSHPQSRRTYSDFFGNSLRLGQKTSYRTWDHIVSQATINDFTIKYNHNQFQYWGQDGFTTIAPPVNGVNLEILNMTVDAIDFQYKARITDDLKLEPAFGYQKSSPIAVELSAPTLSAPVEGPGAVLQRYHAELTSTYKLPRASELMLGGGYIEDADNILALDGTPGLFNSSSPGDFVRRKSTKSAFGLAQYMDQIGDVGFTVGSRYEDTTFGSAFAPRAGLTYVKDKFNAKLLYGRAFRIPTTWQAYSRFLTFTGTALRPETSDTEELELGYKFSPTFSGKINLFNIDIQQPLVYNGADNSYHNAGEIQSLGLENEWQWRYSRYGGFLNLSYARPGRKTSRNFVTPSRQEFIGMPWGKIAAGTYYKLGKFQVSPSVVYLPSRPGQARDSAVAGTQETVSYQALVLANLALVQHDVLKDLDINLSVHNLFNAPYTLIQPYYGAHAPVPANDREFSLGLTWRL